MKKITTITPAGIKYLDDDGNLLFVDFEICYENFLADRRKRKGSQYMDEHAELYKGYKSVGFRHASIKQLWFFTDPPIEFEFQTEESFWEVVAGIKKAGYRTTDGD